MTGGLGDPASTIAGGLGRFAGRKAIEVAGDTAYDVGVLGHDPGRALVVNGLSSVGGELLARGLINGGMSTSRFLQNNVHVNLSFNPRPATVSMSGLGDVNLSISLGAPREAVENLPTVTFSSRTHAELAENIRHAQAAGHPSVLTHGGDAAANRAASLEGVPNIKPLSRDEYPFASSVEGGPGAWVGHVPASQQNSQGGILSNFFRRNQIKPGDRYRVNTD